MGRNLVAWILCAFVASMVATSAANAMDPMPIAWWKLNEGTGTVVLDYSGNGHNGTVINPTGGLGTGGTAWYRDGQRGMVISFDGTDGTGACVDTDMIVPAMTLTSDFTWVFWAKQHADQEANNDSILGNRYGGTTSPLQFIKFTPMNFEYYNGDATTFIDYADVTGGVWVHNATVKQGATLTYYRDGVETLSITLTNTQTMAANPFYMGADCYSGVTEAWRGYLSDVRLYDQALTQVEIAHAIAGRRPDAELAGEPVPLKGATDVPYDVSLSWTAGESAVTHDVYLGTSFDAVSEASRDNPLDVLVSKGQTDAAYTPDPALEYGKVYYWRVDEVNGAPDNTVFKGSVWSFRVEPYAYLVTPTRVTASSFEADKGPDHTIDGSGLDADGQHSVVLTDMWMSDGNSGLPAWIRYEFDREYKLYELWVWNSNCEVEYAVGYGAKDVVIEYSTDDENWTQLEGVPQFTRATSSKTYKANTIIELGEITAKYVKLTITANWGGFLKQTGLSEVQFYYVPLRARAPDPADGETGVSVDVALEWRSGRETVSHAVYFGTDSNAVAEGSVSATTATQSTYTPDSLNVATTYYWRVDEVGDTGTYTGAVWSFTTEEYLPVDGFDSYNDNQDTGTTIFQTWIDGYGDDNDNGSVVGYNKPPFAEPNLVMGGEQSMPFSYDNTSVVYSEAVRTFEETQDWTTNGVQTLLLHFMGDVANAGSGQLYVKINNTKVVYGGSPADLTIPVWQAWTIDLASTGVNLKKVTSLAVGIAGSGAVGQLFFDEIRLSPTASTTVTPVDPGTTGLIAYYPFDGDYADAAGNHDGTPTGSPGFATGKVGKALNMTADAQYVAVAYSADLAMSTFTVAAWINVVDLDALRAILGTRIGGNYTFDVKADSARIHGDIGNGTAWLNTTLDIPTAKGGLLNIGEWYHVAYVIDNAAQKCFMYLNGALGSTATFSGTPMFMTSAETLGIGYCSSGEYMHGQIDEVRIYNRALSAAEVAGLVGRTGTIYVAP